MKVLLTLRKGSYAGIIADNTESGTPEELNTAATIT
jgi:hypothetical protein